MPLPPGTDGPAYLASYKKALEKLDDDYRMAFVVAGTDVVLRDKLGGLCLNVSDVAEREKVTIQELNQRGIPAVILGGGGYSRDSAASVVAAISACAAPR